MISIVFSSSVLKSYPSDCELVGHGRFVFHEYAALQIQAQRDGGGPGLLGDVGFGNPGQQLVQAAVVQVHAVEADVAGQNGDDKHNDTAR